MIAAIKAWWTRPDRARSALDEVVVWWLRQVAVIVLLAVLLAPTLAFIALGVWMITEGK